MKKKRLRAPINPAKVAALIISGALIASLIASAVLAIIRAIIEK
jgi:hypothetical protein